ncbi:MAG: VOC family protein [Pseudomonadota bacterium]
MNTPSYLEIGSKSTKTSSTFFADVFGWEYAPMDESNGWFQAPTIKVGIHDDDPNPQIYVFFAVDDLQQAMNRVRKAGGIAEEPEPVEPGFGRFCNCKDPTGIAFGLHEKV